LANDAEVFRVLVNYYYRENEQRIKPNIQHFCMNNQGLLLLDTQLDRLIQVYIKPNGITCANCTQTPCEHTEFANKLPETQQRLQQLKTKTPKTKQQNTQPKQS